jgi:hypothetical protein
LKYQNRRAEYIEKLECSRLDKSRSKISWKIKNRGDNKIYDGAS